MSTVHPSLRCLPEPGRLRGRLRRPPLRVPKDRAKAGRFCIHVPVRHFRVVTFKVGVLRGVFIGEFDLLRATYSFCEWQLLLNGAMSSTYFGTSSAAFVSEGRIYMPSLPLLG